MKKVQFINSYCFVFCARPGTPAAKKNIVKDDISKQRLSNFQELSEKIKINYKKKLLDSSVEVLFENRIDENSFFGRDKFFNSVIVKSNQNLIYLFFSKYPHLDQLRLIQNLFLGF